ncbi:ABC transporter substrate-binding protein [Ancylobacter sp. G4_0304]|uniref:ABC transporter substrate-binding protein n=1 Tax=Ancylobacter sp. G4_0304 TaxID=3114289 RepID=UPI0039C63BCD
MTIKNGIRGLGLVSAAILAFAATPGLAGDLTIVGWGGATQDGQREAYFKPFAAKEGIKVLEDSWDGGYGVLQSKVNAGNPNWDVVQVESEELVLGCADGIYEKLDWAQIGPKEDFLEESVSDCGIGTLTSGTGLAYDSAKWPDGPKSWADFWDLKKYPGKRALRKGPKYTLEFALMGDGVPADKVYEVLATPEGVDRAFKKLEELGPNLIWWEAGAQPIQYLASGEVAMSAAYNGRVSNVNAKEGKKFVFVWPGNVVATDSWVILKGSANKEAAQKAIAFMSQPENQAKMPKYVAYGITNKKAAAEVPPELEKNLPTNVENLKGALPLGVEFWIDNNESLTQRFNAWLATR